MTDSLASPARPWTDDPRQLVPGMCRHCGHSFTTNAHPNGTGRCVAPVGPADSLDVCGCRCDYVTEAEAGVPW